jgi:hypothetical protein
LVRLLEARVAQHKTVAGLLKLEAARTCLGRLDKLSYIKVAVNRTSFLCAPRSANASQSLPGVAKKLFRFILYRVRIKRLTRKPSPVASFVDIEKEVLMIISFRVGEKR